jgi:hypothetical protein
LLTQLVFSLSLSPFRKKGNVIVEKRKITMKEKRADEKYNDDQQPGWKFTIPLKNFLLTSQELLKNLLRTS